MHFAAQLRSDHRFPVVFRENGNTARLHQEVRHVLNPEPQENLDAKSWILQLLLEDVIYLYNFVYVCICICINCLQIQLCFDLASENATVRPNSPRQACLKCLGNSCSAG